MFGVTCYVISIVEGRLNMFPITLTPALVRFLNLTPIGIMEISAVRILFSIRAYSKSVSYCHYFSINHWSRNLAPTSQILSGCLKRARSTDFLLNKTGATRDFIFTSCFLLDVVFLSACSTLSFSGWRHNVRTSKIASLKLQSNVIDLTQDAMEVC